MKGKYNIILLLTMLVFPIAINALSGQVTVSCEDTVIGPGDTLTCSISGNSFSSPISSFHAKITLGEGLTLVSATGDSSWYGSGEGGIIDLYTDENKTGKINFVSFVVKVNKKVSDHVVMNVEEITVSDDDFVEHKLDVVSKEIKVSGNSSNVTNNDNNSSEGNVNNSDKNNNIDLDNETVNNNKEGIDDIGEENNEIETDVNIEKNNDNVDTDSKTGNIWLAVVLLIISIIFICVIIYLRKRGKNV